MSTNIDSLSIQIEASSAGAAAQIDRLSTSLQKLKSNAKVTSVVKDLTTLSTALRSLQTSSTGFKGIQTLANGLSSLQSIGKISNISPIAKNLAKLSTALTGLQSSSVGLQRIQVVVNTLNGLQSVGKVSNIASVAKNLSQLSTVLNGLQISSAGLQGVRTIISAIQGLQSIGKVTNLTSALNQLKRIPEITNQLDKATLDRFAIKMDRLSSAMQPLAASMERISTGFARLPASIRGSISAMNKMAASSGTLSKQGNKLTVTLNALHVKYVAIAAVARRAFNAMGGWVATAADYEENMNLFTVSMGKYAEDAMAYAEAVEAAMGIDISQWTRNQGIFMSIAKGFGLMEEQAYVMSRGLTELAYDLSSFFNIALDSSGDGALDKVKSAIAGELEPLRRLGFALDQATLQQVAYAHGVTESFASMTQAEKALLRYTAMVEQATSMGAVGDLSRTIDTFSNQVRILKQRFTALGRAAGQAIIPALQAILPWVQAVIVLFTRAAQAVAAFFGFKLAKIDYSGLDGMTESANAATEALGGAGGAAKDLANATMGFDELNVINDKAGGGGGGGGAGALSDWASMWELDSLWDKALLDGISSQVDGIVKKLQKFTKPLKNILKMLWDFKEFVVAGFAIAAVVALWKKVKTVWVAFLGLKVVDKFLDGFTLIRAVGGNVFESLRGGFDNIRMNLTGVQKAAITAVAGLVEFAVVKTVFQDLVLGTKDLGAGIAELVLVIVAAGTAMYAALGPIGLLITAVVALGAAVVGYNEANKQMIADLVNTTVFDGYGASLDTLSERLETVTDKYKVQNEAVIELSESIESGRETIERIGLSIDTMTASLGASGTVTKEEVDALKSQFAGLYDEIKKNMENSANIILTALAGALADAVPEVQESIKTLIGEYQLFVRETQGRAAEIEIEVSNIYDSLVGMIPGSAEYAEALSALNELYTELGYLQGGMSDAEWQWGQTVESFNAYEFDWSSVDDAKSKVNEIGEQGAAALEAVASARDAALKKIDEDIQYASKYGSDADVQLLYDVRSTLESNYAAQEAQIKTEITTIFADISGALGMEANNAAEAARGEFENLNWFGEFWNGSAENYAAQAVESFNNDIYTPISTEIATVAANLKLDSEAIGIGAVDGIVNGVKSSWTARNVPEEMNNYGLDTLRGFADGIQNNLPVAEAAAAALGESATNAAKEGLGEHSTHNTTESPNVAVESFLSQILMAKAPQKYYLSAVACQGILRRAENRGKKLPPVLQAALERQAAASESKDQ